MKKKYDLLLGWKKGLGCDSKYRVIVKEDGLGCLQIKSKCRNEQLYIEYYNKTVCKLTDDGNYSDITIGDKKLPPLDAEEIHHLLSVLYIHAITDGYGITAEGKVDV
jgi:hypothetical protein